MFMLRPQVSPRLTSLSIQGRGLLDERGLDLLAQAFEDRHRTSAPMTSLLLEPPPLSQGRGLARLLLSGSFNRLEHLTVRCVNALGIAAIARFLSCGRKAPCLLSLALFRGEGYLAWADPVVDALSEGAARHLQVLHTAFLPFGKHSCERFISQRLINDMAVPIR